MDGHWRLPRRPFQHHPAVPESWTSACRRYRPTSCHRCPRRAGRRSTIVGASTPSVSCRRSPARSSRRHQPHAWVRRNELHNLVEGRLLTFDVYRMTNGELPNPDHDPNYYLQQVHSMALTPAGRDRARGRVVMGPVPDSSEDDGRAISQLVLQAVADALRAEYRPSQCRVFLREAGVPVERLEVDDGHDNYALLVLIALDEWGSEGRRVLRTFLGQWLSGPTGHGDRRRNSERSLPNN